MITLISIVVLSRPSLPPFPVTPAPVSSAPRTAVRQAVFTERIRTALGEAWRVLIS